MRMVAISLVVALTGSAAPNAMAQAIEGRYRVEGASPDAGGTYKGEAGIKRSGDTYSVVWQLGSDRFIGTGIVTGPVLSITFEAAGGKQPGVASFAIVGGKVREGRWTLLGGDKVGRETWTAY